MAEEREDQEQTEEAPKGGSKGKLLIIVGVVAVLLIAGLAAVFMMGGSSEEGEPKPVVYERADFGEFIVNLSSHNNFIKLTLIVEYDPAIVSKKQRAQLDIHGGYATGGAAAAPAAEPRLPGIFTEREPMIRDAVIRVLSAKTAEEVLSVEGKEILKEELIDAINEACNLDEDPVVAVYFQEFLVQ